MLLCNAHVHVRTAKWGIRLNTNKPLLHVRSCSTVTFIVKRAHDTVHSMYCTALKELLFIFVTIIYNNLMLL